MFWRFQISAKLVFRAEIPLLKKFDNVVDYKNVKLLSAFLNKYGKIKPRRKTRLSIQQQRSVAKAIRKARDLKLLPFVYDVKG